MRPAERSDQLGAGLQGHPGRHRRPAAKHDDGWRGSPAEKVGVIVNCLGPIRAGNSHAVADGLQLMSLCTTRRFPNCELVKLSAFLKQSRKPSRSHTATGPCLALGPTVFGFQFATPE